jgi:hypothetical protein
LQIFVIKFGWKRTIGQSILRPFNNNKWIHTFSYGNFENFWKLFSKKVWDHAFKKSACLRGGGVSPCADGPKVTVHKDQKSPA